MLADALQPHQSSDRWGCYELDRSDLKSNKTLFIVGEPSKEKAIVQTGHSFKSNLSQQPRQYIASHVAKMCTILTIGSQVVFPVIFEHPGAVLFTVDRTYIGAPEVARYLRDVKDSPDHLHTITVSVIGGGGGEVLIICPQLPVTSYLRRTGGNSCGIQHWITPGLV